MPSPEIVDPYGAGGRYVAQENGHQAGPSSAFGLRSRIEPIWQVQAADELLEWGIADYTFIPGPEGILGSGKFSTVYKVHDADDKFYALKLTPLYPHHPLIANRLLREPELLRVIPAHPNLVGVEGWLKTPSHFYLIETFSSDLVPLNEVELPVTRTFVKGVMDQLVSVVRDGMHKGGKVVHRDLKAENVLCSKDGNIILLDLGLSTHFSSSSPRLTTCCGSPAFHSPEIINALNHPPGEIRYYGPELDIWCIGLTILSLLLQLKYPIGSSHKDLDVMARLVRDRLNQVDELYPMPNEDDNTGFGNDWRTLRNGLEGFLVIDGIQRMKNFQNYRIGKDVKKTVEEFALAGGKKIFKSVFFYPAEVKYTLPLYLQPPGDESDTKIIVLKNTERLPAKKVVSYLKYLLRSAGILYHHLPISTRSEIILQCVISLPKDSPLIAATRPPNAQQGSFLDSIFGRRSTSGPPLSRSPRAKPIAPPPAPRKKQHCLRFYLTIDCGSGRRTPSTTAHDGLKRNGSLKPLIYPERPTPLRTTSEYNTSRRVTSGRSQSPEDTQSKVSAPRPPPNLRSHSTPRSFPYRGSSCVKITLSDTRATSFVLAALEPYCSSAIETGSPSTLEAYVAEEHENVSSSFEDMQHEGNGDLDSRGRTSQRSLENESRSKAESARPSRPTPGTESKQADSRDKSTTGILRRSMERQVSDYVAQERTSAPFIQEDKPYEELMIRPLKGGLMMRH